MFLPIPIRYSSQFMTSARLVLLVRPSRDDRPWIISYFLCRYISFRSPIYRTGICAPEPYEMVAYTEDPFVTFWLSPAR